MAKKFAALRQAMRPQAQKEAAARTETLLLAMAADCPAPDATLDDILCPEASYTQRPSKPSGPGSELRRILRRFFRKP
jgi:hypothetical protein